MVMFVFKESIKLISRAKFSFVLSLISTSISVLLITVSVMLIQFSDQFQSRLKSDIKINIFLKDDLTQGSISQIEQELKNKEYVNRLRFIDKNEAAENFIKETGEDFRKLLDYNPLPASFVVKLNEPFIVLDTLDSIVADISNIKGIDEVVYQDQFTSKVLSVVDNIKKYIFMITAALFLISIYIVYSTVKLIINSKYEELETMKLVGAKISTIKLPILLNGLLIGIFAGIISLSVFLLFTGYFTGYLKQLKIFAINIQFYEIILLLTGPLLGFFISLFSLRKVSLKI
jgi:cell division transport system permease protein